MANQTKLNQNSVQERLKIYIREADGASYQIGYDNDKTLQEIIKQIYQKQFGQDLKLICKGKLLALDKNLKQNKIQPDQIVHVLKKTIKNQQRDICQAYISYERKLHKINFRQDNLVQDFKQIVERQTQVPVQNQIILFKDQFLQNDKKLKQYDIKNEDILKMGNTQVSKLQLGKQPVIAELPFPIKMNARSRRCSADQNVNVNPKQQKEQEHKEDNKFSRSDFHITISKTFKSTNMNIPNNKININCLSPSMIYGNSSQISQEDIDGQFHINIGENKSTLSQEGSPLLPKITAKGIEVQRNIFANPNSFQANLQNFKFQMAHDGEQNFKLQNLEGKDEQDQLAFNFQTALDQLMSPGNQQVVFCQSYYEKEGQQSQLKSPSPISLSQNQDEQEILRKMSEYSPNSGFKKAEHEKQSQQKQHLGKHSRQYLRGGNNDKH